MKILLTGAKGFIGGRFLELYSDKYDIVQCEEDIRYLTPSKYHGRDIQAVVHLAAMVGVRASHNEPELYWDVNVIGSKKVFQLGFPTVYASSSSIHEWWLSPYAKTKKRMEEIAPTKSIGLRFHTVYGDNSREDMLYDMLLKRKVRYLTNHKRDWTHVDDICSAIDVALANLSDILEFRAIDVGTAKPVSVIEVAEKLWPNNNLPIIDVAGERDATCADNQIIKELGWNPQHHILDNTTKENDYVK